MTKPSPQLKKALDAMKHCEEEGREVTGMSVLRDGYKLDFAPHDNAKINSMDLSTMSRK